MCGTDCFLMLLSLLFPPIGVWVKRGICGADSLINIALCCLGYLPGLIHAWYIILQFPDPYDYEQINNQEHGGEGIVTYYYVARGPGQGGQGQGATIYGTVGSQPSAGQFPGQQTGTVNAFAQQPKPAGQQQNVQPMVGQPGQEMDGEGSSEQSHGPPPTYADVIKGDYKAQMP